jgi:hypothetical protein
MKNYWFLALMASICLEGLGRRYIPAVPSLAFLLLKDAVLLVGYQLFKPDPTVSRVAKYLYRGFGVAFVGAFVWTILEIVNPEQHSILLALIGMRGYWLWWIAPPLVATVLQSVEQRRRAIYVLSILTIAISLLAAMQFVAPPDSAINTYTSTAPDDEEAAKAAETVTVVATGRARVASTFSYITGFSDFTILAPVLLLCIGLEAPDKRLRTISLVATVLCAMVLPMSGSRMPVVLGFGVLAITCWSAGLFFTNTGRRILIGGIIGIVVAGVAFPDAIFGVQSRFENVEETSDRILSAATVIPPVALATLEYPMAGEGTGTQQNAAYSFHIYPKTAAEMELHRYLAELGPIGFLLAWTVKFGLVVAFIRAYSILKKAGRRAVAGAALSYAAVTFFGHITYDHVWASLYFVFAGFMLAETKAALEILRAQERAKAAVGPPPVTARA